MLINMRWTFGGVKRVIPTWCPRWTRSSISSWFSSPGVHVHLLYNPQVHPPDAQNVKYYFYVLLFPSLSECPFGVEWGFYGSVLGLSRFKVVSTKRFHESSGISQNPTLASSLLKRAQRRKSTMLEKFPCRFRISKLSKNLGKESLGTFIKGRTCNLGPRYECERFVRFHSFVPWCNSFEGLTGHGVEMQGVVNQWLAESRRLLVIHDKWRCKKEDLDAGRWPQWDANFGDCILNL